MRGELNSQDWVARVSLYQAGASVCGAPTLRPPPFCDSISSGGAVAGALRLAEEVRDAVIVTVICDRGDRYLSTGLFAEDEDGGDE